MKRSVFIYLTVVLAFVVVAGCSGQAVTNSDNIDSFNWRPAALNNAGSHPANIAQEGVLAGISDKLFFASFADAGSPLCICGSNGENLKYTEHSARGSINLHDDYIYYMSGGSTCDIVKQGINDGNKTTLYDESSVWRMVLLGERIFFIAYDGQSNETGILYSMDKHGEGLLIIDTQVLIGYLDFDESSLFFAKMNDGTTGVWDIYEYDISSLTSNKIVTITGSPKQIVQNIIVYEFNGRLCFMNLDTGISTDIFKADPNNRLGSVGVNGNMVFYTTANIKNHEYTLFAYDIDAKTTFCLGRVGNSGICFANDTLFTVNLVTGNIEKDVIEDGIVKSVEITYAYSGIS